MTSNEASAPMPFDVRDKPTCARTHPIGLGLWRSQASTQARSMRSVRPFGLRRDEITPDCKPRQPIGGCPPFVALPPKKNAPCGLFSGPPELNGPPVPFRTPHALG